MAAFRINDFDWLRQARSMSVGIAVSAILLFGITLVCPQIAYADDGNAQQPDLRFTILHTNDLHAHDEPFTENSKVIGGMARVGHVIRQLRSKDVDTVTIDAGDIFQGTPLYNLKHGDTEVNLLNMIGYDIATIGNHEFDDGPNNLAEQLRKAKYDVVCANLDFSAVPALSAIVKPSVVKVIHGEKVGFIGVMTPEITRGSITLGDVRMKQPLSIMTQVKANRSHGASTLGDVSLKQTMSDDWYLPIRDEVARLQTAGINKIVVVSHCGVELDESLARHVAAIDVIVGGHSHTRIFPPVIVDHSDGSATMIVQTGCYGRSVGELAVAFDAKGRLLKSESREQLIDITDKVPEDPDLKAYVDEQARPLRELEHEVVGHALGPYSLDFNDYLTDSPIGDLVCDALFEEAQKFGATIVLQNRGGVRSHIETGLITAKDAESVLPFDNTLVIATISGEQLRAAIENGLAGYLGARFLEVHGIKYAYDRSKPPGNRIVLALAQSKAGGWEPIQSSSFYRICINSYNFKSGEGHDFSKATDVEYCEERLSSVFESYLKKQKEISPGLPDRIVALNSSIELNASVAERTLTVKVSGVEPGANLTLVAGTDKSVQCFNKATPVPVAQPHILFSDAVSNKDGTYEWTLNRSEIRSLFCDEPTSEVNFCVVAKHGVGPGETAISYPRAVLGVWH